MIEFKNIGEAMAYSAVLAKRSTAAARAELPPLSLYKPKPKDIIAGGDPVRTPVDRVAARVVAPAPEWAKPPPPPATKAERHKVNPPPSDEERKKNDGANRALSQGGYSPGGKDQIRTKKEADFNVELTDGVAKRFERNVEATEDLVRRAEEATAAVKYLVEHVPIQYAAYDEFLLKALRDTRAAKAAIEIETKLILATLADVRKFFLDPKHEEEVAKLKEFINLCERLRALKDSGFLDTIADTILRLEIGNQ